MRRAKQYMLSTALVASVAVALAVTSCRTTSNQPEPQPASGWAAEPASPGAQAPQSLLADSARTTGGFTAEARSTSLILIHWDEVPGAKIYQVFRSTKPKFELGFATLVALETFGDASHRNHFADTGVFANTRYYYAVTADAQTKLGAIATGSCMTPADDGPLRGVGEPPGRPDNQRPAIFDPGTPPTTAQVEIAQMIAAEQAARRQPSTIARPATRPVGPDEPQRQALRQKDGVKVIPEGLSSQLPLGTYGFDACPILDGPGLWSVDDGRYHDSFEVHRLADGKYIFVGYVCAEMAKNLKQAKAGTRFTFYSHRWDGASEIVSLPAEHLRMAGVFNPSALAGLYFDANLVTMDGKNPVRAVGNMNRVMDLEWR